MGAGLGQLEKGDEGEAGLAGAHLVEMGQEPELGSRRGAGLGYNGKKKEGKIFPFSSRVFEGRDYLQAQPKNQHSCNLILNMVH